MTDALQRYSDNMAKAASRAITRAMFFGVLIGFGAGFYWGTKYGHQLIAFMERIVND